MTKNVENRLAKIGVPSAYIGITALIVTLICSQLGV
jgi:hypothetical protein